MTAEERRTIALQAYNALSICIFRRCVARRLVRRLAVVDTGGRFLTAVTTPGAILANVGWLAWVAVALTTSGAVFNVSSKIKALEDASTKLSQGITACDLLLLRLNLDASLDAATAAKEVSAVKGTIEELSSVADVAFLLATKSLRSAAEADASEELRQKGYTENHHG